MNRILIWLKGYVIIRVQCNNFDPVFRMCKAHHIYLYQVNVIDQFLYVTVFVSDYKEFFAILKKLHAKGKVIEKRGFPFLNKRILKKYYFCLFFILFFFALFLTQRYIWAIEIQGNIYTTDNEIMDYLSQNHIYYGMKQHDVVCKDIEQGIREQFPSMTWVSVHIYGTKLHVRLKENDILVKEETIKRDNIYANTTGEIVSVLVKQGIAMVKPGDKINKGDILVSGKIPILDENMNIKEYQETIPQASIKVISTISHVEQIENVYQVMQFYPNEQYHYFFECKGKRFYLNFIGNKNDVSEVLTCKKQVMFLHHIYFPFFYGYERVRKVDVGYVVYTDHEMKHILLERLSKYILCLREKGVQIIEKNVKISKNGSVMHLSAELLVEEIIE